MADTATFTTRAARKIADAAQIVLRETIDQTGRPAARRVVPIAQFDALVGAATQDGSNYRWTYAFTEVYQTAAGWTWTTLPDGRTGTMRNRIEVINGASGQFGNGTKSSDFPTGGTFQLAPIPSGTPVRVTPVFLNDGTAAYWFESPNGLAGGCTAP